MIRPLTASLLLASALQIGCATQEPSVPPIPIPAPDLADTESAVAGAIDAARAAAADAPNSADRWGTLGMVLQAHDFIAEAVTSYQQASLLNPLDYRWPYLSALTRRVEQPRAAREDFQRAADLSPDNPAVFISFGDLLLEQGETTQAQQQYDQALVLDPGSAFAQIGLARLELLEGRPEDALHRIESTIVSNPGIREAHTLLARIATRLKQPELAQLHQGIAGSIDRSSAPPDSAYLQVVERGASTAWASRRAFRYAAAGQYDQAETQYRQLVNTNPTAQAHAGLAVSLAAQGNEEAALDHYRKALELDPNEPVALGNLGQHYLATNNLSEAENLLTRAIEIDAFLLEPHLNLALVRGRQRRFDESLALFDRALELRPGDTRALNQRAQVLTLMGRSEEAIDSWRDSLKIDQQQIDPAYNLAVALAGLGNYTEAVDRLKVASARARNSSRITLFLAWLMATAPEANDRDGQAAVELALRVRNAYPDMAHAADVLAAAHAETNNFDGAIAAAEAAVRLAQGTPRLGSYQERLELYRQGNPFRLR